MSLRIKAIYKDGAFIPITGDDVNVAENSEVELTVHNPYILPPTAESEEDKARALRDLIEDWQRHPLTHDAPRLTRDELHERR